MEDNTNNIEITQPIETKEISLSPNLSKPNKPDGGRRRIDEDEELQEEYFKIFRIKSLGSLSNYEVAKIMQCSPAKVSNAVRYVTNNWTRLTPDEGYANYKNLLSQRKRDIEKDIAEAERGSPVIDPLTGQALLDENGKPYIRKDKEFIRRIKRDRIELDKLEMQLDCMLNQNVLMAKNAFLGQVNITENNIQEIVVTSNKMTVADRNTLKEVLEKYARPPE